MQRKRKKNSKTKFLKTNSLEFKCLETQHCWSFNLQLLWKQMQLEDSPVPQSCCSQGFICHFKHLKKAKNSRLYVYFNQQKNVSCLI